MVVNVVNSSCGWIPARATVLVHLDQDPPWWFIADTDKSNVQKYGTGAISRTLMDILRRRSRHLIEEEI